MKKTDGDLLEFDSTTESYRYQTYLWDYEASICQKIRDRNR